MFEPDPVPEAMPPHGLMAWETPDRSFWARWLGTVRSTFAPNVTVDALAQGELAPALRFALLWMLPWMPLWGIVPFTHALLFKAQFQVEVVQKPGILPVPWDVLRAMGIGFVLSTIGILSWALPFASLLGAFAQNGTPERDPRRAAFRLTLYRAWVLPCGFALYFLVVWALPEEPASIAVMLAELGLRFFPRLLVLMHCFALARLFGLRGLSLMAVAGVPLLVEMAVAPLVGEAAIHLLPEAPKEAP